MVLPSNFLSADLPLRTGNAAAALLTLADGRYLLQLRDDIPQIWYPGHWGLFGGGVDAGENEIDALRRELREELEFELTDATLFTRFNFDLTPIGLQACFRSYYEVPVSGSAFERLVLHEGAELRVLPGDAALSLEPFSPYDGFALFLHYHRARLS
jgi:8-oxo-dGTP pyrophosphatase MutT (NUDIX family)